MDNIEKVKKYFSFLVIDLGFKVVSESENSKSPESFRVVFESEVCRVSVFSEYWNVYVDIVEPNKYGEIDLGKIVSVLELKEKFIYKMSNNLIFDEELQRLAKVLLQYCLPILKGDFSIRKKLNYPSVG